MPKPVISLANLPPDLVEYAPGKFMKKSDPRLALFMPNSSSLPGAVTRSPVRQCNEAGEKIDVPEWRKRGFDSKSEMLYVD